MTPESRGTIPLPENAPRSTAVCGAGESQHAHGACGDYAGFIVRLKPPVRSRLGARRRGLPELRFVQLGLKLLNFLQQLGELLPERRQPILDAWRDFGKRHALEDACPVKMFQPVAQYLCADAFDVALQC